MRRIQISSENTLSTAFYNGQVRTFKFSDYVDKLKGAFTDIESTGEVFDQQRKICILIQGISDNRLRTGKATPNIYTDFETVVNFLTTLLDEEQSMAVATRSHQRNVSALRINPNNQNEGRSGRGTGRSGRNPGRGRGGRGGRSGRGHGGRHHGSNVMDRSYTREEWLALSFEDKQKVRDLRSKRNREMNSSSITTENRNVNPRITEVSDTSTIESRSMNISGITSSQSSGLGSQMSQRQPRNNNV
jgi:hypothetical protein